MGCVVGSVSIGLVLGVLGRETKSIILGQTTLGANGIGFGFDWNKINSLDETDDS